jgi:hypothetical protein
LGVEVVQGLNCSKLLVKTWIKRPGELLEDAKWFLWLAHDRNYLPIKVEAYKLNKSLKRPMQQSLLSDLREVAPGIWFPYAATTICNDPDTLEQPKTPIAWKDEYRVQEASLNPNYEIGLFRDIQFPSDTTVYEVEGERITGAKVIGKSSPITGREILMWVVIAIILATLLFVIRRVTRRWKLKGKALGSLNR